MNELIIWLNALTSLKCIKDKFCYISTKNMPQKSITILLNNQAIAEKEYVKYLGVIVDSKLSFQQHITISKKNL